MGSADILLFGTAMVGIALLILGAATFELSRNYRSGGTLMGIGLGLGILAFSAKLLLIVAFLAFGDDYFARFPPQVPRSNESVAWQPGPGTAAPLPQAYVWEALPPAPPEPRTNPSTPEKVALGKALFHDPRLSVNDQMSCASCHDIHRYGGGDGQQVASGFAGQQGTRNTPTVVNAAYQSVLFWDGRARSLEEQAKGPLVNPIEMGMPDHRTVANKVAAIPEYREAFALVFGGPAPVTIDHIAMAIAAYERTLITPNTPYDRFVRGDSSAMTEQQVRGMALFAEFGCVMCHRGPNFSDASLVGGATPFRAFPSLPATEYEARYHLTRDRGLAASSGHGGIWRIPSLRNVTRTAPYFHNGSVTTLPEAVRIMAQVQLGKPASNGDRADWRTTWSPVTHTTEARANHAISDAEVDDIVAFLRALEDEVRVDAPRAASAP